MLCPLAYGGVVPKPDMHTSALLHYPTGAGTIAEGCSAPSALCKKLLSLVFREQDCCITPPTVRSTLLIPGSAWVYAWGRGHRSISPEIGHGGVLWQLQIVPTGC
jgi:hypothetical protein